MITVKRKKKKRKEEKKKKKKGKMKKAIMQQMRNGLFLSLFAKDCLLFFQGRYR